MSVMAAEERWFFTKKQLEDTPSRRHGVDPEKELSYRQQSANLIQDMGQRLHVSQLCINTAIVYMQRFFLFHPFPIFNRNVVCGSSLFLAAKVEEQPRKLEHIVRVMQLSTCRDGPPPPQLDPKSDLYIELASELVVMENLLLQTLGFELAIDHPHTHVVKCCQLVRASKDLAQTSYFMATNSLHLTTMCLQHRPTIVACVCIHMACKWSSWEIPQSSEGKEWFWYVDKNATLEQLEELTAEFLAIFNRCPSRLKKKVKSIKGTLASAFQQPCLMGQDYYGMKKMVESSMTEGTSRQESKSGHTSSDSARFRWDPKSEKDKKDKPSTSHSEADRSFDYYVTNAKPSTSKEVFPEHRSASDTTVEGKRAAESDDRRRVRELSSASFNGDSKDARRLHGSVQHVNSGRHHGLVADQKMLLQRPKDGGLVKPLEKRMPSRMPDGCKPQHDRHGPPGPAAVTASTSDHHRSHRQWNESFAKKQVPERKSEERSIPSSNSRVPELHPDVPLRRDNVDSARTNWKLSSLESHTLPLQAIRPESDSIPPATSFSLPPPDSPSRRNQVSMGNGKRGSDALTPSPKKRKRTGSSSSSNSELVPLVTKLEDMPEYTSLLDGTTGIKMAGHVSDGNSVTPLMKQFQTPDPITPLDAPLDMPLLPLNGAPLSTGVDGARPFVQGEPVSDVPSATKGSMLPLCDGLSVQMPQDQPTTAAEQQHVLGDISVSVEQQHSEQKKKKKEKHKHREKHREEKRHKHKHKDKDKHKEKNRPDATKMLEPAPKLTIKFPKEILGSSEHPKPDSLKLKITKDGVIPSTPTDPVRGEMVAGNNGSSGTGLKIKFVNVEKIGSGKDKSVGRKREREKESAGIGLPPKLSRSAEPPTRTFQPNGMERIKSRQMDKVTPTKVDASSQYKGTAHWKPC